MWRRDPHLVAWPHEDDQWWSIEVENPGLAQTIREALALPELAFSLVALGLLAVTVWLATPGAASSGATGAVLLLAGSAGLAAIPITMGATLMLVLAAGSLWFEVRHLPGMGLHAIGGWLTLTLAGFFLHGEWVGAHPAVVLPVATLTAAGAHLAGRRYRNRISDDPFTGPWHLTDRHTVVLHADGLRGQAVVGGQLWTIRSRRGCLHPGQRVTVVLADRDCLIVEPASPTNQDQ